MVRADQPSMTPEGRLRAAVATSVGGVAGLALWHLAVDDRLRQIGSDVLFVVAPALSTLWLVGLLRRREVAHRAVAAMLALATASFTAGNGVWFWHEVVQRHVVPEPHALSLIHI